MNTRWSCVTWTEKVTSFTAFERVKGGWLLGKPTKLYRAVTLYRDFCAVEVKRKPVPQLNSSVRYAYSEALKSHIITFSGHHYHRSPLDQKHNFWY